MGRFVLGTVNLMLFAFCVLMIGGAGPLTLVIILIAGLIANKFVGVVNTALTAWTSAILIGILVFAFQALPPLWSLLYHHPDEILATARPDLGFPAYKPKRSVTLEHSYGDLRKMTQQNSLEKEVRAIEFVTDQLGFRNRTPYKDGALVIIGDSFIVGSGTTQSEILAEQITALGTPTYGIAYPGAFSDYVKYVDFTRRQISPNAKTAVFIFEGNDFGIPEGGSGDTLSIQVKDPLRDLLFPYVKSLNFYRFTWSLMARSQATASKKPIDDPVEVYKIGMKNVGFLRLYHQMAKQKETKSYQRLRSQIALLASKADFLFFIPEKSRVYADQIPNADVAAPSPTWKMVIELASQVAHAKCFDLTEKIKARSIELLAENKYTYWSDDTHWNGNGIAVAAKAVHQALADNKLGECPRTKAIARQGDALNFEKGGPLVTTAGQAFNVQPGGGAALWAQGTGVTFETVITWNDVPLVSIATPPNSVTAEVPSELFSEAGTAKIALKDLLTHQISGTKEFIIAR